MRVEQRIALHQDQRLSQKAMLLPHMQQALQLLQLPLVELAPILRAALESNPLWEVQEPSSSLSSNPTLAGGTGWDSSQVLDQRTLLQQVEREVLDLFSAEEDRERALEICRDLSEDGLLGQQPSEYARQFCCSEQQIEKLLLQCQSLDPAGIFARSPQEALLLQMERLGRQGTWGYRLIQHHFEDLVQMRMKRLCLATGYQESQLLQTLKKDLHGLRRGRIFEEPQNFSLIADATLRHESGRWTIEIHDDQLPLVHLQSTYLPLFTCDSTDSFTHDYLDRHLREGLFFKRALFQRCSTLRRILEIVIPRQEAFLSSPAGAPTELTMSQIAAELGLSESTLSRAVQSKWIGTPRGLISMRSLFVAPGAVQGTHVGCHLQKTLQEVIASESKSAPLSDAGIAEKMKERGFSMARRTVAKYRANLGIPGQQERRWRGKAS